MAKTKQIANEREYIVPLRREYLKVQKHKRTPKAVKALKQFIARHMRVPDRDTSKVKLDDWLNKELWFKGIKNPPNKIKVHAKRDGENIIVTLVDLPAKAKFAIAREEKKKKVQEEAKKKKQAAEQPAQPVEEKAETSEEDKKEEKEKATTSAEAKEKAAEVKHKQDKHTSKAPKQPKVQPQRKALKK